MSEAPSPPPRALRVCALYPDLMNIYADRGNLLCSAPLRVAGIGFELTPAASASGSIRRRTTCSTSAADRIATSACARRTCCRPSATRCTQAAARGAVVLGVCGGYQLLGHSYVLGDEQIEGVGLLDVHTVREPGPRLIGNVAIEVASTVLAAQEPSARAPRRWCSRALRTTAGVPAGRIGASRWGACWPGSATTGARGRRARSRGSAIGTYLHGPLLPKNAWFADWLIARALALQAGELAPLDDALEREAHLSARHAAGV